MCSVKREKLLTHDIGSIILIKDKAVVVGEEHNSELYTTT